MEQPPANPLPIKYYKVTPDVMQGVLNVMAELPYKDVFMVVEALRSSATVSDVTGGAPLTNPED